MLTIRMHRGSVHEAVEAREYPTLSRMRTWNSMFIQGFYISKTICSTIISITCTFYTLLSFNHLPVSLGCMQRREKNCARRAPPALFFQYYLYDLNRAPEAMCFNSFKYTRWSPWPTKFKCDKFHWAWSRIQRKLQTERRSNEVEENNQTGGSCRWLRSSLEQGKAMTSTSWPDFLKFATSNHLNRATKRVYYQP